MIDPTASSSPQPLDRYELIVLAQIISSSAAEYTRRLADAGLEAEAQADPSLAFIRMITAAQRLRDKGVVLVHNQGLSDEAAVLSRDAWARLVEGCELQGLPELTDLDLRRDTT